MEKKVTDELQAINLINSYQLAISILPLDKKISEFVYYGLKQIKEISFCRVCLYCANEPLGDRIRDEKSSCNTCNIFNASEKVSHECIFYNNDSYKVISIQSINNIYGNIIINNSRELTCSIDSCIRNFANFITLYVENKIQEENLKKQNEILRISKEKAEESDRLKSSFLTNLSHEIRTPMNAIQGFASILHDASLPNEQIREFATYISESTDQMLDIFSDILILSSLDAGQEKLNKSIIDPTLIIEDIYTRFYPKSYKKGLQFSKQLPLDTSKKEIYLDIEKIKKILDHLLSNSIKFTDKGYVSLGFYLSSNKINFSIKDSGIGIDNKYFDKIFNRFWQLDSGLTRSYEGNGLGLSIAKGYAELMDGNIKVKSSSGKGAEFLVTIPF